MGEDLIRIRGIIGSNPAWIPPLCRWRFLLVFLSYSGMFFSFVIVTASKLILCNSIYKSSIFRTYAIWLIGSTVKLINLNKWIHVFILFFFLPLFLYICFFFLKNLNTNKQITGLMWTRQFPISNLLHILAHLVCYQGEVYMDLITHISVICMWITKLSCTFCYTTGSFLMMAQMHRNTYNIEFFLLLSYYYA